jgi:hypothetical protein
MRLWIIGHWCCCNMGDKYQPYVIANLFLKNENPVFGSWDNVKNINFVNFSGNNGKKMQIIINNKEYTINAPEDEMDTADYAILTTGSMHQTSPYFYWIQEHLKKELIKKLIIWGGFSRGSKPFDEFKIHYSFLNNPNIEYFARSQRDLEIYEQLTNKKGRLAGDPMCYWITNEGLDFGKKINNKEFNECKGLVVIPSIYAIEYNNNFWNNLCEKADNIICIDTYADCNITKKYNSKSTLINEPWIFYNLIKNSKHTINGRLHSGVLSACSKVPTTIIVTDDAEPGKGTFKFEAVGANAVGYSKNICKVTNTIDYNYNYDYDYIPKIEHENCDEYLKLTLESLEIIKKNIIS